MSATRAALHGMVTATVVALRVLAAVADVLADVLRRMAEAIAAGREKTNEAEPTKTKTAQRTLSA